MSGFLSLAVLCAFCTVCMVSGQTGVCYVQVSTQVSHVGYYQTSRGNDYNCGWWRRCRRTVYGQASRIEYSTQYSPQFGCCSGYQQVDMSCQPVCAGGCSNGGVCTAPNTCTCPPNWSGSNCHIDVDECSSATTNNCQQNCVNNPGSFSCACNTGYSLNADGNTCADVNECIQGTHLCQQNCMNTVGSYTCSCNTGYSLNPDGLTCPDIDECSEGTDQCQHNCMNTVGSYTCSCNTGYRLDSDGLTCPDIDECSEGTDLCQHNCMNTVGSYTCSCNTGYTLSTDLISCINDNECQLGTDLCGQVCHDTPGSYTCSCRSGYALNDDGLSCRDIDECLMGIDTCEQNCHNNIGSYTCSCDAGYTLNTNGRLCDDVNECAAPGHGCQHQCDNFPGSYRCLCNIGYSLNADERTCSDIDECTVGTDNCDQICYNNVGSFSCTCMPGSTLDSNGYTCHDIDECSHSDLNVCQQLCINIDFSYSCGCNPGYVLHSDQATCSDVNECEDDTDLCTHNCENTVGSYTCTCDEDFVLNADGITCDDIDECADEASHQCQDTCVNIPGSYNCTCRVGYQLNSDGYNCSDIDECTEEIDRCEQDCMNTIGSYNCSCGLGFIIDVDGYSCDDINECGGDHMCEVACNNTAGSFHCACTPGWVINDDGRTCGDLDECSAGVDLCDQNCFNAVGAYTCSCGNGYTLNVDGLTCDDINECSAGSIGNTTCDEVCVNTPGSWECGCYQGYTLLTTVACRDEDECTEGENECDQMCHNNIGSYTCSCNSTTTLNSDGFHCDDIDECAMDQDNCAEVCVNTYGSFYCSCNTGYTINADGRTCRDVDECQTGSHLCEQLCTNTEGSYNCSCNPGYSLTTSLLSCLGPPEDVTFSQVDSTTMTLTWGLPQNDSDDGILRNYVVDCGSDGDQSFALDMMLSADSEKRVVLQNLDPYTAYTCCLLVETDMGSSPLACTAETTLEEAPENPPQSVDINNDADDSLTFNVEPPVQPYGLIIAYTYYLTFDNGSTAVIVDRDGTGTFNLEGLLPYQLVTVEVSANTSAGEGPKSSVDEIRTAQAAPSAPTGVTVIVTSNSSLTVAWNPPDMFNGILRNYTVRIYNQLNEYSMEFEIQSIGVRSVSVDDLEPYIPYTIDITASTDVGEGEPLKKITFTKHGVPNIPSISYIVRISKTSAKVFWTPLTPDEARGVLTQLSIAYQPASDGVCPSISQENMMMLMTVEENVDTQSEAEIFGLDGTKEYCMAIQVSTRAGESGYSNTVEAHFPSDVYVQVRFRLTEECKTYVAEIPTQKSTDVSSAIVEALLTGCSCPYSLEYVTHSRLLCGKNEKEAIYQANLLNTDGKTAAELKDLVQLWVDNGPNIEIAGTYQQVNTYCQISVTEIGNTEECVALNPTTPTEVQSTELTKTPVNLIVAISVGGGAGTLLLLLIVVGLVCCCRRGRGRAGTKTIKERVTFTPLDAESDNTYLIGHENIRNSAIVSHTPADYDRADDTNFENTKEDAINFENPLYGAGVDKDEFEDMKQDLGSDSCSDSNSDAM